MAYENLCMYCFKELNGETVCPHCGGDASAAVPQIQMLPGTLVYRERFLVGRALGQDSSGIVYNAMDTKRGGVIRIREYLPRNCAERLNDGGVVPIAGMEEAFETGMRKLRASVDSVEDPKKRHFYFEENGTAYIAQRKGGAAPATEQEPAPEDEDSGRKQIILYICIAAAVVLAVAIGMILFFNSMGSSDDLTMDNPLNSASPGTTWAPDYTPTPTPHATATFAALVDPELSWMDYTYNGDVNSDYQQQASATQKPAVQGNQSYPTVKKGASESSVRELQQYLVKLGWLNSGSVTGKYDSATTEAVRAFQHYVNEHCSPAEKLAEDGIAGKKTQQWLYNSNVSLTKPTATPTPKVTPAPNTGVVNGSSSASEIRDLQNGLIALGLMPKGSADGKYGSATSAAVKSFQNRVNQLQGYTVLTANGTADALTRAWLNYYVEEWKKLQSATATPAPATPTPAPAATGTPAPGSDTVDTSSSREAVTEVQRMLNQVGLLSASDVDGAYGSRTAEAVRRFQEWINELCGNKTLEVTGTVDSLTKRYLEYCVANGRVYDLPTTPAPTFEPDDGPDQDPVPTEVPPSQQAGGDGITPGSPAESIQFMQEMLSEIGLMDAGQMDGVYGAATEEAVRAFQRHVNEIFGEEMLAVTGRCDSETLSYLQQAYDQGWNLEDQGDVPDDEPDVPEETPTSVPTEAPTVAPTEAPTETPTEAPIDGISPESPMEEILEMQQMLNSVGLLSGDQVDGIFASSTEEALRALQRAVNAYNHKDVLEITGRCDQNTLDYLKFAFKNGMDLRKLAGIATEEPTEAPTEAPTQMPTETPTEAPVVGRITTVHFAVSGQEANGLMELTPGSHQITWGAEGDVKSYYIYLYDGAQNLIQSAEDVEMTGFQLNTSNMVAGEIYELRVGAMPVNDSQDDIYWQSLQLMLPVIVTPEPTLEPTAAPSVSAPVITLGSAAYQQDGVQYNNDSTAIFSWAAEGQVESYTVNLSYEDGTSYSLGTTTDTSRTVNTDQLKPGLYRLYVGATPMGGGADSTVWSELVFGVPAPAATAAPEAQAPAAPEQGASRITYLDQNSDPEDIQTVQMALYRYGLLNAQGIEPGVLDQGTLEAVAVFQARINEALGLDLPVIDPSTTAAIDSQTLDMLLYQNLDFNS